MHEEAGIPTGSQWSVLIFGPSRIRIVRALVVDRGRSSTSDTTIPKKRGTSRTAPQPMCRPFTPTPSGTVDLRTARHGARQRCLRTRSEGWRTTAWSRRRRSSRIPLALTGASMPDGSPPERGWMAGRLIDGFDLVVKGRAPEWEPASLAPDSRGTGLRSIRPRRPGLRRQPHHRRGAATVPDRARRTEVRKMAHRATTAPVHPNSLAIDCRTETGRAAPVVWGRALLGMARGAIDAEPITVVEASDT